MDAFSGPPIIRLHPDDGVAIARSALPPGAPLGPGVAVARRVPAGHKVALRPHAAGEAVRRYGQIIGFATEEIPAGEWVHTHNLSMGGFARDYAWGVDAKPTEPVPEPATFMGIRRAEAARRRHHCSRETTMPVRPERKALYPADWKAISLRTREAADWKCEWCPAVHGQPHPVNGKPVVITTAHMDHDEASNTDGNLGRAPSPGLRPAARRGERTGDAGPKGGARLPVLNAARRHAGKVHTAGDLLPLWDAVTRTPPEARSRRKPRP